jgi:hypothetical protein
MKKQNQKNERRNSKSNNFRINLGTAMFVIAIMLFFLRGCGFQQNSAAEIADNNAAYTAEVLGDQSARTLDTSAVSVDVIKESEPEVITETVTETVTNTVLVPGEKETIYVNVPGETVYVEVPGETRVEKHTYALTSQVDNGDGTYTCIFTCGVCTECPPYEIIVGEAQEVHTHNFVEVERVEATCVSNGFVKTACDCGSEKIEVIPATGHNYVEVPGSYVAPTYESEGKEADQKCENCGDVITGAPIDKLVQEPEEHVCEFVVVEEVAATCTADGFVKSACECGEEEVVVIPATGHNYVEVPGSYVAPTYESEGKEADQKCENCGDVITGAPIDKLVQEHTHAYVETARVEATCCENGYVTFTCECGDSYTEEIAALGHDYVTDESSYVAPTEESEGKEADTVCSRCGDRIEGNVIPKLVHESHKDETYCEFNHLDWGFPSLRGGQCTSYEAYISFLQDNYPNCQIVTGSCMVEVAGEMVEGTFVYAD